MAVGPVNGSLLVVVGETASGKSALALELAERFGGEIICADSRTVYKGMDIGTAKPSAEERARVPHYCLDIVSPGDSFTVADFKRCATEAIEAIHKKGKLPIMVGGTGLYIDSVLYDYQFRAPADPELRRRLEGLSVLELQEQLASNGVPLPENTQNPRHLIRAIETNGQASIRKPLRAQTTILGLTVERAVLEQRIKSRVDAMVASGFVDEVKNLVQRYGEDNAALQAPGYKAFRGYISGAASMQEAKQQFIKNDLNLAKRQRTWFKRNNSIQWFDNREDLSAIVDFVTTELNKL